ncbi:MAG: hypothetical protein AAGD05_15290, partial [Bacteroidota bacterium]
ASPFITFYLLFIAILLVANGCHQKTTNQGLDLVSTIESKAPSKITPKKEPFKGKPAVMYRSNDLGATWHPFAEGIPEDATVSAIKPYGNKVYVATDYHGIFVISDRQASWVPLRIERFKDLDINCLEVEADQLVIGTLRHGIIVSSDGGRNWQPAKQNMENSPIRAFIKSGNKLLAGTDAGIFESMDKGNTWTPSFGQMQILGFTSLNNQIYAATQHGALKYDRHTENWTAIYDGDALHDIGNDGRYIYAMTIGQQLLKTQNDGVLWENAQNGITYPVNYYTNELQHIDQHIFSAQWIGIYYSANYGNSWRILDGGLPDSTAFSTLEITDLGIIAGISIR